MADASVQEVYDQLKQDFSVRGASSGRFTEDFLQSCNDMINDINSGADLQTKIELVSSIEDTIVGLDVKYLGRFAYGVSYHLIVRGRRPAKDSEAISKQYGRERDNLIDMIYIDITNAASADDDDNETSNVIGLGALN